MPVTPTRPGPDSTGQDDRWGIGTRLPRPPLPDVLICAALFLAALAVYTQVLQCGFLTFDDPLYVNHNPEVTGGFTLHSLKWAFLSFDPDNWFPLTRLSHLVDYTLFGDAAGWHHAMNVLIHALASVALFGFLRNATGDRRPAAFVAFLFALHPLHVESVAWISEKKDVLCALFWFSSLWAWCEWVRRPSRDRYFAALALFALGLMSKPMIVTLPALLFLLDIWPLRRRYSRALITEKLPFFALSACDAILTWSAQSGGGIHSRNPHPLALRLENALVTPWIYVGKTLWPARLSVIYSWPGGFPLWQVLAAGTGLIVVSLAALAWRRRRPWFAVGWFWFLISLTPVIGLVQVGEQVRADRYMYVPMIGLGILAAWSAGELTAWRPVVARFATLLSVFLLAVCAAWTWVRIPEWKDSTTLFGRATEIDPLNDLAWFHLAAAHETEVGMLDQTIATFGVAVSVRPDFVEARDHLGRALLRANRGEEALAQYREAMRADPGFYNAFRDMGLALVTMHRAQEAVPYFEKAAELMPGSSTAHFNLGMALTKVSGRTAEGESHLRTAQALQADAEARREMERLEAR